MSVGDNIKHPEGSTHLNSHANMVVVGKICLIISYSDHSAVVSGFTHEIGTVQVPIVDAVIAYEDKYQAGKVFLGSSKCSICQDNEAQFDTSVCDAGSQAGSE